MLRAAKGGCGLGNVFADCCYWDGMGLRCIGGDGIDI